MHKLKDPFGTTYILSPCLSTLAHLVGAEPVGLDVVLHGEAVVKQEAVVALAPVAVVHLLWWRWRCGGGGGLGESRSGCV